MIIYQGRASLLLSAVSLHEALSSHHQDLLLFVCELLPVFHLCMSAVYVAAHCSASQLWSQQSDRSIGRVTLSVVHAAQPQSLGLNNPPGLMVV